MLDIHLINSLAVRDGLMEEIHLPQEEQTAKSLLSRELYKQLRDAVQYTVRKQFALDEVDPKSAETGDKVQIQQYCSQANRKP